MARAEGELNARAALERVGERIRLDRGSVRVTARFHDGTLQRPVRMTVFRIPPSAIAGVTWLDADQDSVAELLEAAARDIDLATGDTELVAEYDQSGHGLRLKWVDFTWSG